MKVTGKSHKGKNRIREAGTSNWVIIQESNSVQCLDNKPGFFIIPITDLAMGDDSRSRWILQDNDPNFKIEEM